MIGRILVLLALFCTSVDAQVLQVKYEDGRPTRTLPLMRIETRSEELYVEADALCKVLDLQRFWKPETQKMVIKLDERRIQVTVGTRLVLVDRQDRLLRSPVHYREGHVMVPLEFVDNVLVSLSNALRFDRSNLSLQIGLHSSDVLSVEYRKQGTDLQAIVQLRERRRYRVQTPSASVVRLRIFEASVDPVRMAAENPDELVRRVRAESTEEDALLYFELATKLDDVQVDDENGGRTIILTLQTPLAPVPAPEFKLPARDTGEIIAEGREDGACQLLVLDAGHGGYDHGVRASGLVEKEVTLELAKKLQRLLDRKTSMRVELVRRADRALAADRRAELANKMRGDLFISLHCNSWFGASASGFEVLFVSAGMMIDSPDMMTRTTGGSSDDFLPWDGAQLPYAADSQIFAQILQTELDQNLEIPNRGAKEADIELLKGVAMPAIVLEVGYLSNLQEARDITSPDFAERLATALAKAVERYCSQRDAARFGERQ